ncbi:hypothetical protein J6590_014267 [Homalodisca vitripennis]|nr:hypothetical protein J6590_014267 [Homalodisca vitripennis]
MGEGSACRLRVGKEPTSAPWWPIPALLSLLGNRHHNRALRQREISAEESRLTRESRGVTQSDVSHPPSLSPVSHRALKIVPQRWITPIAVYFEIQIHCTPPYRGALNVKLDNGASPSLAKQLDK